MSDFRALLGPKDEMHVVSFTTPVAPGWKFYFFLPWGKRKQLFKNIILISM